MQVVNYKTDSINPSKYNPRNITDQELSGLKESIKRFGFIDPLIVNIKKKNNVLIGGHQRLKVAELLKMEFVPVVEVSLSISEEKALNVALNSPTISGSFDEGILNMLLIEIKEDDPDLFDDLNFGEFDFDLDFDNDDNNQSDSEADNIPDVEQNEYDVQLGDTWILGNHRLRCGDSTKIEDVEKLMSEYVCESCDEV